MRALFLFLGLLFAAMDQVHSQVAYTSNLTVDSPCAAGLKELSNEFEIYPNPAKDVMSINYGGNIGFFQLLDVNGKLVLSKAILNGKMDIDLKNIESGMYIGILTSEDRIHKVKLVIN